jgi:hypothetical protein
MSEGQGKGRLDMLEGLERALEPWMPKGPSFTKQLEMKRQEGEAKKRADDDFSDNDDMMAGADLRARSRDIDKVAAGCAFVRDTLVTGGANLKDEIQWHDMMAVACYCDEPQATAHRLCQHSQYYDPNDTVIKLAEAQKARERDKSIGFPFCATLEKNGAAHCATCKYRKYNKSPLNTPEANEAMEGLAGEEANYGLIPEVVGADGRYQPIPGGYYEASDENIARLNGRISRVVKGSDTLFYENMGPGGHQWRKPQAVEAAWAGAHVKATHESHKGTRAKSVPLYKWYTGHTKKLPPALPVFKPREQPGPIGNNEYNMWSGWGVQPDPNYDVSDPNSGVRIIINHIRDVLCQKQKDRFAYVMAWLAWKVQNPEKPCEAVIIFRSTGEGSGKNIVAGMVARFFGHHGAVFENKSSVVGDHATNEYLVLMVLDETLFHGDRQTADLMKGLITGETRTINPKYQDIRTIPNMGSFIILCNHEVVVTVGKSARRYVILDCDESRTGDLAYFKKLKSAVDGKGAGQLLHYLLNMDLRRWHPRHIIKTQELADHQIAAMPSGYRWLAASAEFDELTGSLS